MMTKCDIVGGVSKILILSDILFELPLTKVVKSLSINKIDKSNFFAFTFSGTLKATVSVLLYVIVKLNLMND